MLWNYETCEQFKNIQIVDIRYIERNDNKGFKKQASMLALFRNICVTCMDENNFFSRDADQRKICT